MPAAIPAPAAMRPGDPRYPVPQRPAAQAAAPGSAAYGQATPRPQVTPEPQAAPGAGSYRPARQPIGENEIGKYALSIAAAILVLLAGASLLALVWDSIPDLVKIIVLAIIALVMTVAGIGLSQARPHQRVAAATLTGTGGGLGFVSIIGAVLLDGMLPAPLAFSLMALWGLLLLAVSHLTRVVFTAVISMVGGLVTMGFAISYAYARPEVSITLWWLILVDAVALSVTTTVLTRRSTSEHAAWYPLTSIVVVAACLLAAPMPPMLLTSFPGALLVVAVAMALLMANVHVVTAMLWHTRLRSAVTVLWCGLPVVVWLTLFQLFSALDGTGPTRLSPGPQAETILTLALLAVCSLFCLLLLARLLPAQAGTMMEASSLCCTAAVVVFGLINTDGAELWLVFMVALAASALPALRADRSYPLPLLALLGLPAALLPTESTGVLVSLLLAVLLCPLLVIAADSWLHRDSAAPMRVKPYFSVLAWGLGAELVVILPVSCYRLLRSTQYLTADWTMALAITLATALTTTLVFLGLGAPGLRPATLLTGRCIKQRLGVSASGEPLLARIPNRIWATAGFAWTVSLACLSPGGFMDAPLQQSVLVVGSLAAATAGTWQVWPWRRHGEVAIVAAMVMTILVSGSVIILTGTSLTSVLMSATILLIGAAFIVLGFRMGATALRHYGLVLVLVTVLKLALVDIGDQTSLVRVLSLAAAGVVCFLLSLAYTHYANQEQRRPPRG